MKYGILFAVVTVVGVAIGFGVDYMYVLEGKAVLGGLIGGAIIAAIAAIMAHDGDIDIKKMESK